MTVPSTFPNRILFRRSRARDEIAKLAGQVNALTLFMECPNGGKDEILNCAANTLGFPKEYRQYLNWDSFEESMMDLSWIEERAIVLIIGNSKAQWAEHYEDMGTFSEICFAAISKQYSDGRSMDIVFLD